MKSIVSEIMRLRTEPPIAFDKENRNSNRLVTMEADKTKTAYYFTAPIYNQKTGKILSMKFQKNSGGTQLIGSNAITTVADQIRMENDEGSITVSPAKPLLYTSEYEIGNEDLSLMPTTNGVLCKARSCTNAFTFELEANIPSLPIRANDRYFALMSDKFRPFFTVTCIGTLNAHGELIAPAFIAFQKLTENRFSLSVLPIAQLGEAVLFEMNLYEPKLFQDTTVESANADTNNVYGAVAFLGKTEAHGEQWLYTKTEPAAFSDLLGYEINRAVLHIPMLSPTDAVLAAYRVSARFCSFGSKWNNKIPPAENVAFSKQNEGYQSFDITSFFADSHSKQFMPSNGLILKLHSKDSGFSAIATADNYCAPQILEVNYV